MKYRVTLSEQTTYKVEAENKDDAYDKAHDFIDLGDLWDNPEVRIVYQETNTISGPDLISIKKEDKTNE